MKPQQLTLQLFIWTLQQPILQFFLQAFTFGSTTVFQTFSKSAMAKPYIFRVSHISTYQVNLRISDIHLQMIALDDKPANNTIYLQIHGLGLKLCWYLSTVSI